MEALLGVVTCDKCGETMAKGQPVVIIAEGKIMKSDKEMLTFWSSCIRYDCHFDCWDGVEDESDEF